MARLNIFSFHADGLASIRLEGPMFLRKLTRRSKGPFDRRRDTRFITSKEKRVESKTRTDGDAGRSGFFPRLNSLLDPPQQVELGCDQQRTNERRGAILAGLDNEQRSASKPISPQHVGWLFPAGMMTSTGPRGDPSVDWPESANWACLRVPSSL